MQPAEEAMSVNRLRVGFIGCGRHATKVVYPSLRYAPIALAAVCDLDERLARRNAKWFGAESYHTDYREMLDRHDLDAAIAVTGPTSHAALAAAVIERGLPVFIEKPPALTLAEAEALAQTSEERHTPVTVGFMKRWAPLYREAKDLIATPEFGAVSHIQARFRLGQKKGTGFALLLDAGIHTLDLARFLCGDVAAIHAEKWEGESGVAYAIALRFESGAVGTLHISDQGSFSCDVESVEITGCGSFIQIDNLLRLRHTRSDGHTTIREPGFSIPQDQNNSLFVQGYAPQFQAWAAALLGGSTPDPLIADACRAMRLIKALEPSETYAKVEQKFDHWRAESAWLDPDY